MRACQLSFLPSVTSSANRETKLLAGESSLVSFGASHGKQDRRSTSKLLGVSAKLFVMQHESLISTIGVSKDFKRAVLICLLIRFLEQRSILVEINNRETKIETRQFNSIFMIEWSGLLPVII